MLLVRSAKDGAVGGGRGGGRRTVNVDEGRYVKLAETWRTLHRKRRLPPPTTEYRSGAERNEGLPANEAAEIGAWREVGRELDPNVVASCIARGEKILIVTIA